MVETLTSQPPDLILTPWQARLYAGIAEAKSEVLIASPFIKLGIAAKVRGASTNPDVTFKTVTRFKSSNLTFSGLMQNQEACVYFKDSGFVQVLRSHFFELWENAEPLSRESFAAMIAALSSAPVQPPREKEHFYAIGPRMDFFGTHKPAWNESSVEYASSYPTDLASRIFLAPKPSSSPLISRETVSRRPRAPTSDDTKKQPEAVEIVALNTILPTNGDTDKVPSEVQVTPDRYATVDTSTSHEIAASEEEIQKRQQILERIAWQHATAEKLDNAAGVFFGALTTRFGLSTEKLSDLYALAICSPSLVERLKRHPDDVNPFAGNHVDTNRLLDRAGRHRALEMIGRAVFQCACFIALQKAGLVGRFGSQVVFFLVTYAYRNRILANYWHQNFLGLIVDEKDDHSASSDFDLAALRLLGAISIAEGLGKAHDIAEEFFNPLDPVGENIVDIRILKDAKTLIQEVATKAGRFKPIYQCSIAGGPPHQPDWKCELLVGDTIRASANGSSKGEAEIAAASSALDKMRAFPGWRRIMDRIREEILARFLSDTRYSIQPKRGMPSGMQARIRQAFKDRFGISVDPEYAMLALRAPLMEEQAPGRYSYDNRPLASLGMILSEWLVLSENWHLNNTGDAGRLLAFCTASLPDVFDVDGLRQQLGLSGSISAAQKLDVAQAIVASIYMSVGANQLRAVLSTAIRQLISGAAEVLARTQAAKTSRGRLDIVGKPFDPALSYTTFLQEEMQSQHKNLPEVSYITTGPGNCAVHEAIIVVDGLEARASAMSRSEARNKASFEMLRQLYEFRGDDLDIGIAARIAQSQSGHNCRHLAPFGETVV